MRRVLLVAATLGGCNQVFGIQRTGEMPPTDAQYFDAPADAPFACPPLGTTPRFSRLLHQIPQDCREYTFGDGWAVAQCQLGLFQGPLDATLSSVDEINALGGNLRAPRLFPEGDQLAFVFQPFMAAFATVDVYRSDANHVWTGSTSFAIPGDITAPSADIGVPSRGPIRRIMATNSDGILHELEIDDTQVGAREVRTYAPSQLGVPDISYAGHLSPDGLRMTMAVSASSSIVEYYGNRASLDDRFGPLEPIPGIPPVTDAVMNEDCSRMYYSGGVSSVLWVQRL